MCVLLHHMHDSQYFLVSYGHMESVGRKLPQFTGSSSLDCFFFLFFSIFEAGVLCVAQACLKLTM